MKKQIKKKVKIRWIPLLVFVVLVVFLFFLYHFLTTRPILNIYVKGNQILSDQEIIELAGIDAYPSFLLTRTKSMRNAIKKNPYVKDVRVEKKFWGQVYLNIEEARPLFLNVDGKLVLSNKKEILNDRKLVVASLMNYTPDVKYEALVQELSELNLSVLEKISEIEYVPTEQDKDRFGFYMDDGNLVYVTLTKFSRFNYYLDAVEQVSCKKGIFNFDSGNHFQIKENLCR